MDKDAEAPPLGTMCVVRRDDCRVCDGGAGRARIERWSCRWSEHVEGPQKALAATTDVAHMHTNSRNRCLILVLGLEMAAEQRNGIRVATKDRNVSLVPSRPRQKDLDRFSRFILAKAKNNGATSWIDCYFSSYTRPVRSECLLCCGCRFDWASRGSICCPQCHFHPKKDVIKKSQAWKRRR